MSIFNPTNDHYKSKRVSNIPAEISDLSDLTKNSNHKIIAGHNADNDFDPTEEARKLVSAWKKIEREAESIKDKATNKKRAPSSQKVSTSKLATKPSPQVPKDLKSKKNLDMYIKENIGITGKNLVPKDTKKISQRPVSRGVVSTTTKNSGLDTTTFSRLKDYENGIGNLKEIEIDQTETNTRKSSHTQNSLRESQSLNYSDSMSLQDFEKNLVSQATIAQERSSNVTENNVNPDLIAFLERAKDATMLTFDEAKELYEKLKMEGELDISHDDLRGERTPLREIELTNENIDLGNIKPTDREQRRVDNTEKSKAQRARDDEKKMKEVLATLQKNQQEAKNTLYSFKLDKFCTKIEPIFTEVKLRQKAVAFQSFIEVAEEDSKKCQKVDLLKRLQLQSACFCVWTMYIRQIKFEKYQRKLQTEKESEETYVKQAEAFHRYTLLRRYFNKGFTKHHIKTKQQKDVKKSQNRMKAAIDKFLTKLQPQINEKDSQAIDTYAKQLTENILAGPADPHSERKSSLNSGSPRMSTQQEARNGSHKKAEYDIDRLIRLPDVYNNNTEADEVSFEEVRNDSSNNQMTSADRAEPSKERTTPGKPSNKAMTIEERAKQRKANAELIKKKHEELRAKKEEEARELERKEKEELKRRKIEEKKAWERKRQQEAEAIERKQREQEEYIEKKKMASDFHRTWLLKTYGMKAVRRILNQNRAKSSRADYFRTLQLEKLSFDGWKHSISLIQEEADQMLAPKLREAQGRYESNMRRKLFNVLLQGYLKRQEQDSYYDQYRKASLTQGYFGRWKKTLPALKRENLVVAEAYDRKIRSFLFAKLVKKAFAGLKDNVNEGVKDRIKQNHRNVMWSKVNSWLTDYKATKNKEDSD